MRPTIPLQGPIFNQDCTEFFFTVEPERIGGEAIDHYIDQLVTAGVRTFVSNVNAQKTNYPSRVWQVDWDGYDPAGPDSQPLFSSYQGGDLTFNRRRMDALLALQAQGIDFHHRAFARCRKHGISPWLGIRMNDVHECTDPNSVLASDFFNQQREAGLLRSPYRHDEGWWSEFCLDWEREEVRDHYLALIEERLAGDDVDGLELDWSRFVYHFKPGRELRGGRLLTEWMHKVRQLCDQAGERLGHDIAIGVRVPVDPELSRRCGLDAVAWAHEGVADLIIATSFCATVDFDIPITAWKRALPKHTRLAGGIENIYRSVPNGPSRLMTPRLTLGFASGVLDEGADAVYLFNYFPTDLTLFKEWSSLDFERTVKLLQDRTAIASQPRSYVITFRDARAPGEGAGNSLPARDTKENFPWPPGCLLRLKTGDRPKGAWHTLLSVTFEQPIHASLEPAVYMNGQKVAACKAMNEGAIQVYLIPTDLLEDHFQVIEFVSDTSFCVVNVQLDLDPITGAP